MYASRVPPTPSPPPPLHLDHLERHQIGLVGVPGVEVFLEAARASAPLVAPGLQAAEGACPSEGRREPVRHDAVCDDAVVEVLIYTASLGQPVARPEHAQNWVRSKWGITCTGKGSAYIFFC